MGQIADTRKLYKEKLNSITNTEANWISFLDSCSWHFKYNFVDKVLIYAQRPDATACAEMDKDWNKKCHRWVNKDAKGIFVLAKDDDNPYPFRLVFDVLDTHNSRGTEYKLWSVKPEYEEKIIETLETTFGGENESKELAESIIANAYNMVNDNIQDYLSSIYNNIKGTTFERLSEDEIKNITTMITWVSVSYMMMKRCGINAREKIDSQQFAFIKDFNNSKIITALGTAISDIAEMGIREIAKTVINLQKQEKNLNYTFVKNNEQEYSKNKEEIKGGIENGENRIQENGELSNTKFSNGERANTTGQIRENEIELSKELQESRILDTIDGQQAERGINTDTRENNTDDKSNSGENEERAEDNGRNESSRSDVVGRNDKQHSTDSRGTSSERANLQLEEQSLIDILKTEDEQKQIIAEAENASAFPLAPNNLNSYQLQIGDIGTDITEPVIQEETNLLKQPVIKKKRNKIEFFDLHPEIPNEERNNYIIHDNELGVGSQKEKYERNIEAIKILKICEEQDRYATPEEQESLAQYVGWGGLADVFDSRKDNWHREYEELKNLLTEDEYKEARASTTTAFYTPPIVIKSIYKAIQNMGFQRGNILEPSCRCRELYGNVTRRIKKLQNVWN